MSIHSKVKRFETLWNIDDYMLIDTMGKGLSIRVFLCSVIE